MEQFWWRDQSKYQAQIHSTWFIRWPLHSSRGPVKVGPSVSIPGLAQSLNNQHSIRSFWAQLPQQQSGAKSLSKELSWWLLGWGTWQDGICSESGHDQTWEPSMDSVWLHQEPSSELVFFFLNSVWGCWGKSVKSTHCLSSPKEFLKLLLPIFVLRCLSGYVGYHLWQTFLYECWHFWCFLMGQHHVGSPVERSQQTFWPRGVKGGDGRQWEDDLGPAFLAGVQKAVNTVNSFCKFTRQLVSQNISEMRAFCKHQDTWSKLCLNIPCGCGIPQESVWEAGCHLVIFLEERPWTREFRDLSFGLFLLAASRSLGKSLLLPWSWLVLIWAIHVNH